MKSFTMFARQHRNMLVTVGAFSAAAILLSPELLSAQLPNFLNVTKTVRDTASPVVTFIRFALAVAAVMGGIFQCFKAAKGKAMDWLPAMLLFVVAGIAAAPATFLKLFGMTQLCSSLVSWGVLDDKMGAAGGAGGAPTC